MRYQYPSWWQLGTLYLISGTVFLAPLSTTRIIVGIVMVAVVSILTIVKVIRGRSPNSASRPPRPWAGWRPDDGTLSGPKSAHQAGGAKCQLVARPEGETTP